MKNCMKIKLLLICFLLGCSSFEDLPLSEKLSGTWSLVPKKDQPLSGDFILNEDGTYQYNLVASGSKLYQSGTWSTSDGVLKLVMLRVTNPSGNEQSVRENIDISINDLTPKDLVITFGRDSEFKSKFVKK